MAKVSLQLYDITNSPSEKTNNVIVQINKVMRDNMGVGGIFHGAVEVYGKEWSYGYCEGGSGVFSCPPKGNPMYRWRETIELGVTVMDERRVKELLRNLSQEWEGSAYDLLQKNCNHFCDEFSQQLGAGSIPVWVNRFANIGESAADFAAKSSVQLQRFQDDVYGASRAALNYIWGSSKEEKQGEKEESGEWNRGKGADWLLAGNWHEGVPANGKHILPDEREVSHEKLGVGSSNSPIAKNT